MKKTVELEAKQWGMICCILSSQRILDNFDKKSQEQLNEINKQIFMQMTTHITKDIENNKELTKEKLEQAQEEMQRAIERLKNANS